MPKQSPKDPKFRCNICKEYYYAPEHMMHYQCPEHGYLCYKHIFTKDDLIFYLHTLQNPLNQLNSLSYKLDPYYDTLFDIPNEYLGTCKVSKNQHFNFEIFGESFTSFNVDEFKNFSFTQKLNYLSYDHPCGKKIVKYHWDLNIQKWNEVKIHNK